MLPLDSLHFLYGPLLALLVVLVLGALLRWTFGDSTTAMPGPNRTGDGYGLLVEVARVGTPDAAAVLRRRLATAGVKATVSRADEGGLALLVFPLDEVGALAALHRDTID